MEDSKAVNGGVDGHDTRVDVQEKIENISHSQSVTCKIISWPSQLIDNFHIELIAALYCMGYVMPNSFVQNLVIDKLCFEIYPAETCEQGVFNATVEKEIQQKAAQYVLFLNIVRQVPAIVLSLFMGRWSDIYGRKFAITVPLLGSILTSSLYLLNYYFFDWPVEYIIVSAIPTGLTGDFSGFMLGVFGYVRDIHSLDTLAMRISLLEGADQISTPLGPFIGGQLFSRYSYPAVFSSCIFLHLLAFVLANVKVNDKGHLQAHWKTMLEDFFRIQAILECFKTVFKKRDNNRRAHICALLFTALLAWFANGGYYELIYLYARLKVQWDVIFISYNLMLLGGCQAIGMLLVLPLLIYYFNISDLLYGIFGCVGFIGFYLGTALASDTVAMYCVCIMLIFGSMIIVFLRLCLSKWVSTQEIGKIMSIFAICQALGRNVGQIASTQIYLATLSIFPGAFFVIAAIVAIVIMCIYGWILLDEKRQEERL